MARPKHPNKYIEEALQYAEGKSWRVEKSSGSAHAWGIMYCPETSREGCRKAIYGTPRKPENHARLLHRFVDKCSHGKEQD